VSVTAPLLEERGLDAFYRGGGQSVAQAVRACLLMRFGRAIVPGGIGSEGENDFLSRSR
jgi:hypothetical protein